MRIRILLCLTLATVGYFSSNQLFAQSGPLALMVTKTDHSGHPKYFKEGDGVLLYMQGDPRRHKGSILQITDESITIKGLFTPIQTFPISSLSLIGSRSKVHTGLRVLGLPVIGYGVAVIGVGGLLMAENNFDPDFVLLGGFVAFLGAAVTTIGAIPFIRERPKYPKGLWDYEVIPESEIVTLVDRIVGGQ